MMIAQPRSRNQQQPPRHRQLQQQQQQQDPPAPLVVPAAAARGRSMSRRRRIPPFLVANSSSSSSSLLSEQQENPAAASAAAAAGGRILDGGGDSDPQQQPKVRRQPQRRLRPKASRPSREGQQQQAPPPTTAPRILRRLSRSLIRGRRRGGQPPRDGTGRARRPSQSSSLSKPNNAVDFLEGACPREVVPLVLAYAGPQVAQALSRSNRFWNALLKDEATWKVQCQELYKWNGDNDEEPESWRALYTASPCVPVDYPTVDRALAAVPNPATLWLRPGHRCALDKPVVVTADMTIRAMAVPLGVPLGPQGSSSRYRRRHPYDPASSHRAKALSSDRRDGSVVDETWRSSDDSSDEEEDEWQVPSRARANVPEQALSGALAAAATNHSASSNRSWVGAAAAASAAPSDVRPGTLVLHTRQLNSPVIWVQSGCLTLERVVLSHACLGVDIWNGNAALQIQPAPAAVTAAMQRSPPALLLPPPRAVLTKCQVTSQSGRGVVVMDGGRVTIRKSRVVDCAATGVYIGGPHSPVAPVADVTTPVDRRRSRADLVDSQVSGNGIGSYYRDALAAASAPTGARGLLRGGRLPQRPPVIARGHSGVYLEQGDCHIASSVIRSNALTGISAVSDQARLVVTGSTLDSNGSQQLETVPSSRLVRLENNRIVDLLPRPGALPQPRLAWDPIRRHEDAEDLDDFVRMVMDQP